jgi:hypothetical protein
LPPRRKQSFGEHHGLHRADPLCPSRTARFFPSARSSCFSCGEEAITKRKHGLQVTRLYAMDPKHADRPALQHGGADFQTPGSRRSPRSITSAGGAAHSIGQQGELAANPDTILVLARLHPIPQRQCIIADGYANGRLLRKR